LKAVRIDFKLENLEVKLRGKDSLQFPPFLGATGLTGITPSLFHKRYSLLFLVESAYISIPHPYPFLLEFGVWMFGLLGMETGDNKGTGQAQ
jgi:hypothetical protein